MKKYVLIAILAAAAGSLLVPGLNGGRLEAADGKAILENRCMVCHDAGRIERAGHDREAWEKTVARMMKKGRFGPALTDAEREALLDYLVSL
ncbi:MAG: c-type cytochrome [Desulfosalsimonadaceae bacterium]